MRFFHVTLGAALSIAACGDSSSSQRNDAAGAPTPASSDQAGGTQITPQWFAQLIVIKHVVGGTATAADFTMTVNNPGAQPASFPGSETGTDVTVTAGAYSVSETGLPGYTAEYSADCAGTIAIGESKTCTVTNRFVVTGKLCGHKFYDANANGMLDPGEALLPGWKIELTTDSTTISTYTDENGLYMFRDLPEGDYVVCEAMPTEANWVQTAPPAPGCYEVHVPLAHECDCTLDFGNVCEQGGGGRTPGFWSNQNGEAVMEEMGMSASLALLSALNLRDASGADFDPETYAEFRAWLLGGNAVNMAYMLSVQLAAMELNVAAGFVSANAVVETGEGDLTIAALMAAADAALGADGETFAGDENRAYQEMLKDALDAANNNRSFVEGGCEYTFPPPMPD